jgi:hypothetical protein
LLPKLIKLQSLKTVSNNLWIKTGAPEKQQLPHHSTQKPVKESTVTPLIKKGKRNRGNTHHRKKKKKKAIPHYKTNFRMLLIPQKITNL